MNGDTTGDLRQPRWVLHVDMDAFFASCEQLTRPTLRGRPVLVGGTGGRGVVAGASYEARAFGARSAQPVGQARRAIGAAAVVLPPRFAVYRTASRRVFDLMREFFPVLEQISVDEGFGEPAELVGASVDEVRDFAERLRTRVREETGLAASVGAGAGKQYAKIASGRAKPDGVHVIPQARHAELLDPLPVRALWGIGPVAAQKLALYGVHTVGELAALRDADVAAALGTTVGPAIAAVARGLDARPVHEPEVAKQISSEFTVADDLRAPQEIAVALRRAAVAAQRRLLADGRVARTVSVKLKLADFQVLSRATTLPVGTTDLEQIIAVAERLAPDPREVGAVRLVGVSLSGLTSLVQPSLFDAPLDDDRQREAEEIGSGSASTPGGCSTSDGHSTSEGVSTSEEERASDPYARVRDRRFATDGWQPGDDVRHTEFGHGWVQGAGHGRVSVRFETRATGPGPARTFAVDDADLVRADPVDSLAWDGLPGL